MDYSKDITDILTELVSNIDFTVNIKSVTGTLPEQIIEVDNLFHAQVGFSVTIDGNSYSITAIDEDTKTLTLSGDTEITATSFQLYAVYFFHGTPIATTNEINQNQDAFTKTPMVWLWENFTEKYLSELDSCERETELNLYFLTQCDYDQLITNDIYQDAIKPMKRLLETFVAQLIKSGQFDMNEFAYNTENFAKFGVYAREKGSTKNLVADKMSGVSMNSVLRIYRTKEC